MIRDAVIKCASEPIFAAYLQTHGNREVTHDYDRALWWALG